MTRFYCDICKLFLDARECNCNSEFVTSEAWGQVETTRHEYLICAACGSDVEECIVCQRCSNALPDKGSDNCARCDAEIDAEDKAIVSILTPMRKTA